MSYMYRAGVLTARDEFTGTTAGAALNARVAPMGGTWSTSGSATDFAAADAPGTEETVSRSTTSDGSRRLARLGSSAADTEVGAAISYAGTIGATDGPMMGVIARRVDDSNLLRVTVERYVTSGPTPWVFRVQKVIAGAPTDLAFRGVPALNAGARYRVRVVVFASGFLSAALLTESGQTIDEVLAVDPVFATGGALASGQAGLVDWNPGLNTVTRYYDHFYVATPPAEPIVIHPGRALEIRHDSAERQSADGLTWGSVSPRGGRVYVPCAGDAGRVTRLWVKARRNDVDTMADDNIADSVTLKVTLRPRYRLPTNP